MERKKKQETTMRNKDNTREAEEIFDRILSEMERQGRKYAELIEFLDLPRGTFSSWKAGRSRNYCEHLHAISLFLGVDVGWIVSGEVKPDQIRNRKEKELIETYRKLEVEKQDAVLQNIKWLVK